MEKHASVQKIVIDLLDQNRECAAYGVLEGAVLARTVEDKEILEIIKAVAIRQEEKDELEFAPIHDLNEEKEVAFQKLRYSIASHRISVVWQMVEWYEKREMEELKEEQGE